VIICISIENREKYIKAGFKNVMVYHFLEFTDMYEFLQNYKIIYVDEWVMCPADLIYRLF